MGPGSWVSVWRQAAGPWGSPAAAPYRVLHPSWSNARPPRVSERLELSWNPLQTLSCDGEEFHTGLCGGCRHVDPSSQCVCVCVCVHGVCVCVCVRMCVCACMCEHALEGRGQGRRPERLAGPLQSRPPGTGRVCRVWGLLDAGCAAPSCPSRRITASWEHLGRTRRMVGWLWSWVFGLWTQTRKNALGQAGVSGS